MSKIGASFLMVFLGACATRQPIPSDQIARTESAIASAQEAGASEPDSHKASLHLELAREEVERAKELISAGELARAERMLSRSEADAELARSLAVEASIRRDVESIFNELEALKKETDRGPPPALPGPGGKEEEKTPPETPRIPDTEEQGEDEGTDPVLEPLLVG